MNKNIVALFAVALFVPAAAMAQQHGPVHGIPGSFGQPGHNQPGHNNGGFNQPGHNNNGGYNQPGHNNNGGYNQPGHNNNGGYNQPGHNNNGGYNQPGHNNNGGYNQPGHNNGGYNQPGHQGHPGHQGPSMQKELMMAHRSIEHAFQDAENSYFPFMMSQHDARNMAMAMRRVSDELGGMMRLVDRRQAEEIRNIAMIVERAKFTLISENSAREAHRMLQRALISYNRLASVII